MKLPEKKTFLEQRLARATNLLLPANAERIGGNLRQMIEGLSADSEAEMQTLVQRAHGGEQAAQDELAEIRIFSTDNFLLASSNAASFFNTISLEDTDEPFIENTSRQQVSVQYIGQDGRPKRLQALKYQAQYRVDLSVLSTPEYEYFLRDIYKGSVKSPALANVDMSRDLTYQVDNLLWPYIKASLYDSFGLTGAKAGRVYVPHGHVNTANLPTTNKLVPAGNTSTSTWRKACMDAIIAYVSAWGQNAFPDGDFGKNFVIYMPSKDAGLGLLNEITLTSQPNTRVEAILDNAGIKISYAGYNFTIVGDNTLDPAIGTAYVQLGKPIGWFFTKPGMDETFVDQSTAMRKQNKESVSMSKVIGAGLPSNMAVNVVSVKYRN